MYSLVLKIEMWIRNISIHDDSLIENGTKLSQLKEPNKMIVKEFYSMKWNRKYLKEVTDLYLFVFGSHPSTIQ